ncbi:pyridoxal-phosphate dependent enzyme [Cyclobacteriaceae bacterium]|nr:pyridoxal-phosphate dependent enzyme [Cyclobacteriaceae bacterium]
MDKIRQAIPLIDPSFLNTPQFISKGLSDHFDCQLTVKIETLNPIKSFKGRGAETLISQAAPDKAIVCASAGNFGQAMAYACQKKKIPLTVFASKNANTYKIEMMRSFGATVLLMGEDFDEAKIIAKTHAKKLQLRFVEDSQDIETLAGAGTIGLELLNLPYTLDALLISLGNGALLGGIGRVIKELSPQTELIAVQAEGAPAMIESIRSQKLISHPSVNTISDGIAIRLPVKQSLLDLEHLIDDTLLVSDRTTLKAMKLLHQHLGIVSEPSAAVGIAAILDNKDRWRSKKVGAVICGSNLTPDQLKNWIMNP